MDHFKQVMLKMSKSVVIFFVPRLVALMSTETRMIMGAAFDGCHVGETTLAKRLLNDIPAHSLTLFDRCYFSADLLLSWQESAENAQWLMPAKRKLCLKCGRDMRKTTCSSQCPSLLKPNGRIRIYPNVGKPD